MFSSPRPLAPKSKSSFAIKTPCTGHVTGNARVAKEKLVGVPWPATGEHVCKEVMKGHGLNVSGGDE